MKRLSALLFVAVDGMLLPNSKRQCHGGVTTTSAVEEIRRYIQKFPDWPPGARTANGTALCH
jgi:hypothetical protein